MKSRWLVVVALIVAKEGFGQLLTKGPTEGVAFEQKLENQVPLNLSFKDESGAEVSLEGCLRGMPAILLLGYYECPMMCDLIFDGLAESLGKLDDIRAGEHFEVVVASIDPGESPEMASAKKAHCLERYGRPESGPGWHFLTGQQAAIQRLAEAIGFLYTYDESMDQYAHPAGIVVLTPQGRVSRYFFGVEYSPRDLRLGLVEASTNKIGSPRDQLLLLCYGYDPKTGTYGLLIMNVIRAAGIFTVIALAGAVFFLFRQERRSGPPVSQTAPSGDSVVRQEFR